MRVKKCCFGCSLRTGTLILLWGGMIFEMFASMKGISVALNPHVKQSFLTTARLPWDVINLVLIIYALVGVNKKRPSCLLPYIGFCVLGLILLTLLLFIVLIGPNALRDQIVEYFVHNVPKATKHERKVSIMIFSSVITLVICTYFVVVVYSYYKQLQQEVVSVQSAGLTYANPANLQNEGTAGNNYSTTNGLPQNIIHSSQNPVYAQQNTVYFQQSTIYGPFPRQKL